MCACVCAGQRPDAAEPIPDDASKDIHIHGRSPHALPAGVRACSARTHARMHGFTPVACCNGLRCITARCDVCALRATQTGAAVAAVLPGIHVMRSPRAVLYIMCTKWSSAKYAKSQRAFVWARSAIVEVFIIEWAVCKLKSSTRTRRRWLSGMYPKKCGANLRCAGLVSSSKAIMEVVKPVDMHEMPTETTAAELQYPLKTMAACNAAPGADSNAISIILPTSISENGPSGAPAICSEPDDTRIASTPGLRAARLAAQASASAGCAAHEHIERT